MSAPAVNRIAIIGTGGHARVIADALQQMDGAQLAGLIDQQRAPDPSVFGSRVLGALADLARLAAAGDFDAVVVGIGDNARRAAVVADVRAHWPDAVFGVVVHPSAVISPDAAIGAGSVVMAGTVVNAGTNIGEHCIVNTRSSIDHDCRIASFASIGPGAVLGGAVQVGERTAVGIGAVVTNGVAIGAATVIGAGGVVVADIPEGVVAYGVPARAIRSRQPDEPYMKPPRNVTPHASKSTEASE